MMIEVDPYECLGVKKGCINEQDIKEAYKKKSFVLDPKNTNNLTRLEFLNLNKSYLYIKNQIKKEEEISTPQQLQPQQQSQQPLPNQMTFPKITKGVEIASESVYRQNHQRGVQQFSHLSMQEFDPNVSFQEMSQYRPKTTNYQDLLNQNMHNHQLDNVLKLDSWNGLDNFNQTAPILHDGNQMFIQSDSIMENASYLPQDFRNDNHMGLGSGTVSSNDVQSFMSKYNSGVNTGGGGGGGGGGGAGGGKITNREFQTRMTQMEQHHSSKLKMEEQEKKDLIKKYLNK
jgi:hypothetical protein